MRSSLHRFRTLIPLLASCLLAALSFMSPALAESSLLVIGTFRNGPGIGLTTAEFDSATGTLTKPKLAATTATPSFLTIAPDGRHVYVCNETSPGNLSTFTLEPSTRALTRVAEVPSAGASPCFISLDQTARYAFAANYSDGVFAAFALDPEGRLTTRTARLMSPGQSKNRERQASSHAHCIVPDPTNQFVLGVDLGADRVYIHRFDAANGSLTAHDPAYFSAKPAAGPRHLRFHPNGRIAYIVNELDCTVSVCAWDAKRGFLTETQHVSSLPEGYASANTSAEVMVDPSGRTLYVSNRGLDAIAVFAIDPANGGLTLLEQTPSRGAKPRNFTFDPTGRWMLVANQDGNSIAIFAIDPANGKLTAHGAPVAVDNPGCLRFVPGTAQ